MIDLLDAASEVQQFCQSRGWQFCFIGGLAVQHWGEPRVTRDVDVTLLTGLGTERDFIAKMVAHFPSRVANPADFAFQNRVLLLTSSHGIGLDIALAGFAYEEEVVKRALDVEMAPGAVLRLCTPEDLIVLKCFAGRALDWHDVRTIIVRQGAHRLGWDYVMEKLRPLSELTEQPEIVSRLQELRESIAQ